MSGEFQDEIRIGFGTPREVVDNVEANRRKPRLARFKLFSDKELNNKVINAIK